MAFVAPSDSYSQNTEKKAPVITDSAKRAPSAPMRSAQLANRRKDTVIANDSAAMIHLHVDVQAKFPGGDSEWRKYLEKNFNRDIAVENGAPPGNYTIVISFVVGVDGSISDLEAENNPGYGVAEEAIKIIRNGPKWIPAIKNGRPVAYRQKQSIIQCPAEE